MLVTSLVHTLVPFSSTRVIRWLRAPGTLGYASYTRTVNDMPVSETGESLMALKVISSCSALGRLASLFPPRQHYA